MAKTNNSNTKKPKEDLLLKIENKTIYRVQETQRRWRQALSIAEYDKFPDRTTLYRLYFDIMLDNKLSAVIDLKKDRIQSMEFSIVDSNNEIDEVSTDKFKSKWFYDFLNAYVETIFWGHSLLQIDSVTDQNLDAVELIPRQNVKPEFQEYVENYYDKRGESYVTPELYPWLIEVGGKRDLGLLKKISPLVLWKKSAIQFWSEFQEIFGTPIRLGKTTASRAEDKDRFTSFLRDMGSLSYAVLGKGEEIEFKESNRTDAHAIYLELINFIDTEITTLILGASDNTSSNNGGSLARAQVHEQQSAYKTKSDLRNITFYVNDNLIPKLQNLNILPENIKFRFEEKENIPTADKVIIDEKLVGIIQSGVFTEDYIKQRYAVELNDITLNDGETE